MFRNCKAEGLTDREIEVACLMARGLTAKQIAEQLVISAYTVQAHVRSIRGKIQADGRSPVRARMKLREMGCK